MVAVIRGQRTASIMAPSATSSPVMHFVCLNTLRLRLPCVITCAVTI